MMSDIEKKFAEAYDNALDAEMEALSAKAEKEPHEFSAVFEERMAKTIKAAESQKRIPARRILIAAAAAVLILTAAACAVPGIRSSVAGFFVKAFGNHEEYYNFEVTKERIEEEYGLVPIPEGLEEKIVSRIDSSITTCYRDGADIAIKLEQSAGGQIGAVIDNEHGEFYERVLAGKNVRIYVTDRSAVAFWVEDGYLFSLYNYASSDIELLEELIGAVNPK